MQTTWDQQTAAAAGTTACYNYCIPPHDDGNIYNYPAGCVATAMAQLMRYYQYPTTSIGTATLPISIDGYGGYYYTLRAGGAGGPYVWSNMLLNPSAGPTPTQCQAIGALVADAGATMQMSHGLVCAAPDRYRQLTDFHCGGPICL